MRDPTAGTPVVGPFVVPGMTRPSLLCPLCGNSEFQQAEGLLDSRWGMTTRRLILMICTRCRYILHFYDKDSIFDLS
ncbi:hypothetical protein GCM10014719_24770 [Planomonospora parontospora subsp. antibiotica]|nr:hypothetical protein GCM10014719_24770 [Planomonospora parontospora subsp. antibiotica]GII15746.1 hypothetical protein Ppa05_24720 [Planomonospora parontospora subsp. antibiotica]